jgi:hypothetical protein
MTVRARIDVDAVYHDVDDSSLTVGVLSEHISPSLTTAQTINGNVGTAAVQIVGATPLSTLVVKNTGASVLRLAGSINVSAGRLAVLPVTATITVSAPSGSGTYTALWMG